ncbi:MAG: MoaD/ThiS family protein [Saccharospirillum sp.]
MTDTFKLKFFARLKDELGITELDVPANEVTDTEALKAWLCERFPQRQSALQRPLLTAVNHDMVSGLAHIRAGDEVALFPPVTGG